MKIYIRDTELILYEILHYTWCPIPSITTFQNTGLEHILALKGSQVRNKSLDNNYV